MRKPVSPKNSHPVNYSNRPWPRPWKRSNLKRTTFPERGPQPYQPSSHPVHYHPQPPVGQTIAAPADFRMLNGPEPRLLQPEPGLGQNILPPVPAKPQGGITASTIIWTVVMLVTLAAAVMFATNPRMVVDLIEDLKSSISSSSSGTSSQCEKIYDNFIIHDCYAGNPPKAGYRWCDVTLRGGGGSDWNLNGTNMSQSSEAQAYIPVECLK